MLSLPEVRTAPVRRRSRYSPSPIAILIPSGKEARPSSGWPSGVDFAVKKQARDKLAVRRDRVYPVCTRKCLRLPHFLNEAEGARTLNLRIDSPML